MGVSCWSASNIFSYPPLPPLTQAHASRRVPFSADPNPDPTFLHHCTHIKVPGEFTAETDGCLIYHCKENEIIQHVAEKFVRGYSTGTFSVPTTDSVSSISSISSIPSAATASTSAPQQSTLTTAANEVRGPKRKRATKTPYDPSTLAPTQASAASAQNTTTSTAMLYVAVFFVHVQLSSAWYSVDRLESDAI
jgi:hypothetical protein